MAIFRGRRLITGFAGAFVLFGIVFTNVMNLQTPAGAASLKSPVSVGFACSCSGPEASSIAIQAQVLKGWADYVNAHGGLAGHSVKLITKDDAASPVTALSEVTSLIAQDHVVAIIDGSDEDQAWAAYAKQHAVPVIGVNLSSTEVFTNADFFPTGQTINTLAPAVAAAAKKGKVTNLATVYCSEDPICASLASPIETAAKSLGLKSSFAEAISSSAPSYTAPCLAAEQAGANGIFVGEASQTVVSFATSCAKQSYKPVYVAESTAISNAFLSAPSMNGMIGIQNNLPAFDTSNAAVQTMTTALNHYVPGTTSSPNYSPGITTVWAGGLLLSAATQGISGTPTAAKITQGLFALKGETLGGISPPLTFHKGKATTIGCWFYMGVKDQKFTTPYGTKSSCVASS
jgi:branched-chain amino acid transport system substrate-binding protein